MESQRFKHTAFRELIDGQLVKKPAEKNQQQPRSTSDSLLYGSLRPLADFLEGATRNVPLPVPPEGY